MNIIIKNVTQTIVLFVNYFLQVALYVIPILFLFSGKTNAQAVVQLSPRVSKEIQYSDLRYFGLFSTIDNGTSAVITKEDSLYIVAITRSDLPDTTIRLQPNEFLKLQQYVDMYESILYDDYLSKYTLIQPFTHYVQYSEPGAIITIKTLDGEIHTKKLLYANDEYIVLKATSTNIDINISVGIQVLIFSYKEIESIGTNTFKYSGTLAGLSLALLDNTIANSLYAQPVYQYYNVSTYSQQLYKVASGLLSDILNNNAIEIYGKQILFISAIESYKANTLCPTASSGVMPELRKEISFHRIVSGKTDSLFVKKSKEQRFSFKLGSPLSVVSELTDTINVEGDTLPRVSRYPLTYNIFSASILYTLNNNDNIGISYNFFKEQSVEAFSEEKSIVGHAECKNVNLLYQLSFIDITQHQYTAVNVCAGVHAGVGSIGNVYSKVSFFDIGIKSTIDFRPTPNFSMGFDLFFQRNFYSSTLVMNYDPTKTSPFKFLTANNYLYGVSVVAGICFN